MRQYKSKSYYEKTKKSYIRYVLIDKKTNEATIYHYKKDLANKIGVSVRTLDRNKVYSNERYQIYPIKELIL